MCRRLQIICLFLAVILIHPPDPSMAALSAFFGYLVAPEGELSETRDMRPFKPAVQLLSDSRVESGAV
jgi:hypothetical protein